MIKNLKTLAIIFSVVLNIVFIGSYFYHKSDQYPLTGHQGKHNRFFIEELNLSREQLDRFEPIRERFHAFLSQQGHAIKDKQLELIDLLAAVRPRSYAKENPAREAVDVKQKEIQTLQRQMQAKVIEHLLEESGMFTPQQRKRFFGLIRGRIEKSDGPRPRWMPQTQIGPLAVQPRSYAKGDRR